MRGKDFLNSISDVNNDLIMEAEASMNIKKKRTSWSRWISVAACFLIVVSVGIGTWQIGVFNTLKSNTSGNIHSDNDEHKDANIGDDAYVADNSNSSSAAEGEYRIYTDEVILPENINDNVSMDMIGCLVYKGKVYTQAESYNSGDANFEAVKNLIGECVGNARGSLDEWTSQSDYATEFASTYSGPVYKVVGYSEDFRLCMFLDNDEGGFIEFLENYDAIGLNNGADLFEERMHLSGNIESVDYLTHYDWNEGNVSNSKALTSVDMAQFEKFIDELNKSPFEYIDYKANPTFYECESQGHIYLTMNDGTRIELRLIEGGYVGCQYLGGVYVMMPGEMFDLLMSAVQ